MRILQIVPSVSERFGGPAVAVVSLARALGARGHGVTVASTDLATPPQSAARERITPREASALGDLDLRLFRTRAPERFAFAPGLGRFLRHEARQFQVIHIHSLFLYPQMVGYRAARSARIPYIVAPCGALDPYMRLRSPKRKRVVELLWQRKMLDRAALLHYKSAEEAELVDDLQLAPPWMVVPNGVDVSVLPTTPPRALEGIPCSDDPLLMFVGRLAEKKGIDTLIRVVARVVEAVPVRLAIVGPDDDGLGASLRAIAEAEGVADRVHFIGPLYGAEKTAAIAAADLWVLPSRSENFGQAALEAMASGAVTVLSTAVNLARAATAAGATMSAEPNVDAFADVTLRALALSPAERTRLKSNAQAFAADHSWAAVSVEAERMYEGVIASARSGQA